MLRSISRVLLPLSVMAALTAGCVVEARPGPPRCPGGVWMEGHRGPHGRWHEGHWRCPGVVEEVEID
jgi:hypothetical protein